jgi:hypothetical protein
MPAWSHDGRRIVFSNALKQIAVVSAPADVILDRIVRRPTNNYGKTPVEQAMIVDDLARVEPLLRASCTHELDTSRPLDEVVADLIAIASCAVVNTRPACSESSVQTDGSRHRQARSTASWAEARLFTE